MTKSIGIVGYGYVGKAFYNFFSNHYKMHVYDPYSDGLPCTATKDDINKCDVAVVCVPTPKGDNGECDISIVEEVINWIDSPLILLKSTVEVGTTKSLIERYNKSIVFSPEYCGESTYWSPYAFDTDVKETPFFIFGGHSKNTSSMIDYFLPVTGPVKRYIQTDTTTAEFVKYMENSFYATKIAYCYEMYEIAKTCGIDWNEARELWLADPRINPMHTAVFQENDWPFAGKCLPKDTSAIVELAQKEGYEPGLLKEVLNTNQKIHDMRADRK